MPSAGGPLSCRVAEGSCYFEGHRDDGATPQAAQERSRERRENGVFTRATHA